MGYVRGKYTPLEAERAVGKGWKHLVYEACMRKPEETNIVQVKEKFAGLRIYCDGAPNWYHDFLHDLEARSFHTCEICGRPGKVRHTGWIKTLCWRHYLLWRLRHQRKLKWWAKSTWRKIKRILSK